MSAISIHSGRATHLRIVALATVVLVATAALLSALLLREFNRSLGPELEQRAALISRTINDDISRALSYGIPFDELGGVPQYLGAVLRDYPEIRYVAILGPDDKVRHSAGELPASTSQAFADGLDVGAGLAAVRDHAFAIEAGGALLGKIHVGADRRFVQRQLDDLFYDLGVILVVAVFITFEIILVLILVYTVGPPQRVRMLVEEQAAGRFGGVATIDGADFWGGVAVALSQRSVQFHQRARALKARLGTSSGPVLDQLNARYAVRADRPPSPVRSPAALQDVRIPLFVLTFAEELQKSFLPLYVRELYQPLPWLDEAVVISLPIVGWLVAVILTLPLAGWWLERVGARRLLFAGLAPAFAGFVGSAFADSIAALMFWRCLSAAGYATIIVASQGYLLRIGSRGSEARAMGVFVGVVMSATMCGTAIGGILADRLGFRETFMVAAGLAVLAAVLAWTLLSDPHAAETQIHSVRPLQDTMRSAARLLRNPRLLWLLAGVLVPAATLIAAFLWYLVPLHLASIGNTPAVIARVLMLYYIALVVTAPLAAELVDRRPGVTARAVMAGSLVAGFAVLGSAVVEQTWALGVVVLTIGLAHAFVRAPLVKLALGYCDPEVTEFGATALLDLLRVLERLGMIAGLLLAAGLAAALDVRSSIMVIGALAGCGGLLFVAAMGVMGWRNRREAT